MLKYLDSVGLTYLWQKIVAKITSIVNGEASTRSSADDSLSTRITSATEDITRLNNRMSTVEQLSQISIDGGTAGIASSADFINRTTAGDAKITTVAAVADGADTAPTQGSGRLVTSGGVYNALPKMVHLTQDEYDALTAEQKMNGSWYFIEEE